MSISMLKVLNFPFGKVDKLLWKNHNQQMRGFFKLLRVAFNSVDLQRLEEIGPDRLCAEWIVKNGGAVQFKNQQQSINDYNHLQTTNIPSTMKLSKVDASNSSIMSLGFEHFKGCNSIEHIILHECQHMEDDAIEKLKYVKNSLNELQVTECHNVEKTGLLSLKQLAHLKKLTIYGFTYIEDLDPIVNQLREDLPKCQIITSK